MKNLSKVTAAALGLSLLLAACGSTNRPATTQHPTQFNSGGFEVQGQPNVKRTRLTLPRPTASVMSPRLSAQARTSPLPEWTGPQLFPSGTTDIATNPAGEVFISHLYQENANSTLPPQVVKFTGTGQRLQLGRFPFGTNIGYSNGLDHNQVFITAENPAREAYQLVPLYNVTMGAVTLSAQIYGSGMQILSNGSDQQFPLPIGNLNDLTDVTSNTEGIATVESDTNFDIREMAYENWGEIGLRQHTVLRSPQSLATHPKGARIASASDGSLYVLASVSIPQFENMEECRPYFTATYSGTSCPVVMGLTKFVNGDVAWQVYWDSDGPLTALDLAASSQGASILLTDGNDTYGNTSYNHILSFNPDGLMKGDFGIPLQQLRDSVLADPLYQTNVIFSMEHLIQDDQSRLVVYNDNAILTGTLAGGFTNQLILDNNDLETDIPLPAERGSIQKVVMHGDYLYAIGFTGNKFGNPQPPLINTPDDLDNSFAQEKTFLLPLDFQLRSRSSRS